MKRLIKSFTLTLILILIAVFSNVANAASWVKNHTGKWYYFPTLCCNKFIINTEWGEECYNIPGTCWGAFNDGTEPESLISAPVDVPSLSFLKEINNFTVEIKPDGGGVISVGGIKAVTLTSEGVSDFFKQSPAIFYESTEEKISVQDDVVVMEENKERIISAEPGQVSSGNVVQLGELDETQVSMIKRLSKAGEKAQVEKYAFKISPNPSSTETNLSLTLSKNTQATLYVVDIYGTVKKQNNFLLLSGSNSLTIDLQQYIPGTYLVLLDFGDNAVSGSFIKQ